MYIKLLSTGACANITIREIMLINIISSAGWTLQLLLQLLPWLQFVWFKSKTDTFSPFLTVSSLRETSKRTTKPAGQNPTEKKG